MGLFKLFDINSKENAEVLPVLTENTQGAENEETASPEEVKRDEKKIITITWGTGMPIDIIFNFIHKDFEEDGFQDALVNCDITYRDTKEKIIRNDLEMLFKRIILRYKSDMREVDVNITNARNACAIGAASRLQARKETIEEHLAEINELQRLLEDNDPKMLTMIESYRRGFQKGMAAVAMNFIDNK